MLTTNCHAKKMTTAQSKVHQPFQGVFVTSGKGGGVTIEVAEG